MVSIHPILEITMGKVGCCVSVDDDRMTATRSHDAITVCTDVCMYVRVCTKATRDWGLSVAASWQGLSGGVLGPKNP